MNKAVTVITEWAKFEEKHPSGNLEDFCRHYLASQREVKEKGPLVGGVVPKKTDALLMKIIGRISKLNMWYANAALKGTELNQIEEFGVLVTIKQEKNPKKTEVIYANLFELSSGTDMLARMIKRGLIKEYDDKDDKRSKRLELTPKGEKVSIECYERIIKNATMLMHDLNEDDKELSIQLLKSVEMKFSALWLQHKGKEFDEIYHSIVGPDVEKPKRKKK
ncbi:MAG: winged helix DNA-binding protein [Bacteroidota bacterium]